VLGKTVKSGFGVMETTSVIATEMASTLFYEQILLLSDLPSVPELVERREVPAAFTVKKNIGGL
jgi:hypothetical protein